MFLFVYEGVSFRSNWAVPVLLLGFVSVSIVMYLLILSVHLFTGVYSVSYRGVLLFTSSYYYFGELIHLLIICLLFLFVSCVVNTNASFGFSYSVHTSVGLK